MSLESQDARSQSSSRGGRTICTRTFAARSNVRRVAGGYVAIAALVPLIWWPLRNFLTVQKPLTWWIDRGEWWLSLGLALLVAILVLRWRLRVDESGISQRMIIRWNLWTWQAFEQGQVLDTEAESLIFQRAGKGPFACRLGLGLLEHADRELVAAMINRIRVRSDLALPTELRLRTGFRQHVLIEPGCVVLRHSGVEIRYGWKEVLMVRIRRSNSGRRDFRSLDLVLPARTVRFSFRRNHNVTFRSWSGLGGLPTPSAEVLAGVLERGVSPDRVQVTALEEFPTTIADWEDQRSILAREGNELKTSRRIIWGVGALFPFLILNDLFRDRAELLELLIAGLGLVFIGALTWKLERDHRRYGAGLESQVPEHWRDEVRPEQDRHPRA